MHDESTALYTVWVGIRIKWAKFSVELGMVLFEVGIFLSVSAVQYIVKSFIIKTAADRNTGTH